MLMSIFTSTRISKKTILLLAILGLSLSSMLAQEAVIQNNKEEKATLEQQVATAATLQNQPISAQELSDFQQLAQQKSLILQQELSLTKAQTEKIAIKIYKFSIKAHQIIQSQNDTPDKSEALFGIANNQQDEIKEILTYNQYHYFKRKTKVASVSRK